MLDRATQTTEMVSSTVSSGTPPTLGHLLSLINDRGAVGEIALVDSSWRGEETS